MTVQKTHNILLSLLPKTPPEFSQREKNEAESVGLSVVSYYKVLYSAKNGISCSKGVKHHKKYMNLSSETVTAEEK